MGRKAKPIGYVPNPNKVEPFIRHGQSPRSGRRASPAYQSWAAMKGRCTNEANPDFPLYGGRGITVCDEWLSFDQFFADMGPRTKGQSIERIKNDQGYKPGNCRWATNVEQGRNRRTNRPVVRSDGLRFTTAAEAAEKTGGSRECIRDCCKGRQRTHQGFSWYYADGKS